MPHEDCNNGCDGSDPYKNGGPASPGNPYCDPCYDPYSGPGFPVGGDGPTAGGCLPPDPGDPCAQREIERIPCPNSICDDRLADVPPSKRMNLMGIVGRCIYKFASKSVGFIVSEPTGQRVTNQPCVDIPFLKKYLTHPTTGEILEDSSGLPLEGTPPEYDSQVVADPCGCLNRIQGTKGKLQQQLWNGVSFEFIPYVERDNNPLLNPEEVPLIDPDTCPQPLVAALVPTSQNVTGECGAEETVYGYRLGGLTSFGEPIGTVHIYPGRDDNIPAGYMLCDGAELDQVDFPELFAVLAYSWGGGGNNFRLPDFRGTFLRGVDLGTGTDPDADDRVEPAPGGNTGDAVGSIQADIMQCFSAEYDRFSLSSTSVRQATAGGSKTVARFQNNYTDTPIAFTEGGCGDPRFGDETRPKNAYVNYIIRTGCPPEVVAP